MERPVVEQVPLVVGFVWSSPRRGLLVRSAFVVGGGAESESEILAECPTDGVCRLPSLGSSPQSWTLCALALGKTSR